MLFALVGNIGLILRCLLLFGTLVIGCFLFLFSPVYAADITTSVFVPRAFINEPVEIKVAAIELVRILKEVFPGCTFSETVKLLTTINWNDKSAVQDWFGVLNQELLQHLLRASPTPDYRLKVVRAAWRTLHSVFYCFIYKPQTFADLYPVSVLLRKKMQAGTASSSEADLLWDLNNLLNPHIRSISWSDPGHAAILAFEELYL